MTHDPPDTYPSPREWAEALLALRMRLMKQRPRAFPPGTVRKCPVCGKKTLESREDLLRETIVGSMALIHHNLHGARCRSCDTEFLEAYEELALEEAGAARKLTDYQARVTSVSGKNLGTYWPKDIVRVMDLHSQDALHVQVLDRDTMIIQRQHEHD
jgi:YgiT-type zinc finger domain-containing protein